MLARSDLDQHVARQREREIEVAHGVHEADLAGGASASSCSTRRCGS